MYVEGERMALDRWFRKGAAQVQERMPLLTFLKQGTTKGLKDEERREWEFNLLESKERK